MAVTKRAVAFFKAYEKKYQATKEVWEPEDVLADFNDTNIDESDFPDCCGITVIHKFPSGFNEQDKAIFINACLDSPVGLLVAATTSDQRAAIALLTFVGFERIKAFTNPNSKNRITLWSLTL